VLRLIPLRRPYVGNPTAFLTVFAGSANRPVGVPYNSTASGLGIVYSYSDVDVTTDQITANVVAMMRGNGHIRNVTARKTLEFVYYPRVTEADLRSGWFARVDAMQGTRSTYHAGGMFTFWDVEGARRAPFNARSSRPNIRLACGRRSEIWVQHRAALLLMPIFRT